MDNHAQLLSLSVVANRLRVPATWLAEEAEAGRVPSLNAGGRLLFDLKAVEAVLLERAREAQQ